MPEPTVLQGAGWKIITADVLVGLSQIHSNSAQCCITSPPYWGLRNYNSEGQIGAEGSPFEYIERLSAVFHEVRRVLRADGTLWVNIGDTYAANRSYQVPSTKGGAKHSPAQGFKGSSMRVPPGLKPKDLIGIPWRLAFALQADGWYLRSSIIWHKPNAMPESSTDRPNRCYEDVFLLTKSEKYAYDCMAVKQTAVDGGVRNLRNVWPINTQPYKGAHAAVFPEKLVETCVLAGCKAGEIVLDPFCGSGTTGIVCRKHNRDFIGLEISPEYCEIARARLIATEGAKLAA